MRRFDWLESGEVCGEQEVFLGLYELWCHLCVAFLSVKYQLFPAQFYLGGPVSLSIR